MGEGSHDIDGPKITAELFVLPREEDYIIYAPLKQVAFSANASVVKLIQDIIRGVRIGDDQETILVLDKLRSMGLVDGPPDVIPPKPSLNEFAPTTAILFTSSDCNLRCVYCYASAGERPLNMRWEIAKSAIELVIDNARQKQTKASVGFHGNGEPTFNWQVFRDSVTYAKELGEKYNIEVETYAATNGVLNEKQVEWIVQNMNSVNLSFDGPKDIQDEQRPLKSGKGSFEIVFNVAKQLSEAKFYFGIRATITQKNVKRMIEMLHFFHENFDSKTLHFEPLFFCGRCERTGWQAPGVDEFVNEYIKTSEVAESIGERLFVSNMRLDALTGLFCGAATGTFAVTPEGYVTSCFEVTSIDDPYADMFIIGKFDDAKGEFIISQDKLKYLSDLTVHNIEFCSDCFCKWHCAGDCPRKACRPGDLRTRELTERCQITQMLTKYQLSKFIDKCQTNDDKKGYIYVQRC